MKKTSEFYQVIEKLFPQKPELKSWSRAHGAIERGWKWEEVGSSDRFSNHGRESGHDLGGSGGWGGSCETSDPTSFFSLPLMNGSSCPECSTPTGPLEWGSSDHGLRPPKL
jgi:hypothetical protein